MSTDTDLLSVLHGRHAAGAAALHPHGVPLGARGSVALAWVRSSLLGARGRPLLLLLLGVGVTGAVRLAPHLPHLLHGTGRLRGKRERERRYKEFMSSFDEQCRDANYRLIH